MAERVTILKLPDRGETDEAFSRRRGREITEEVIAKAGGMATILARPALTPPPIVKAAPPPVPTMEELMQKLDALDATTAQLAAATATNKAIEAEGLLAKGDTKGAEAIFKAEPKSYDAYMARLGGGRYEPAPIAKRAPDHRAEIRKLVGSSDHKGLEQLFATRPESGNQYRELMMAGEL